MLQWVSVKSLVSKLDRICELCPTSRVTVSPILPTKLGWLNERALYFNKLLFDYANYANPRVGTLHFKIFCKNNVLSNIMGLYNKPDDMIHLGSTGIFTLSRLITNKIFKNPVDGRQFNHVVAGSMPNNRPTRLHVHHE